MTALYAERRCSTVENLHIVQQTWKRYPALFQSMQDYGCQLERLHLDCKTFQDYFGKFSKKCLIKWMLSGFVLRTVRNIVDVASVFATLYAGPVHYCSIPNMCRWTSGSTTSFIIEALPRNSHCKKLRFRLLQDFLITDSLSFMFPHNRHFNQHVTRRVER